MRSDVSPQEFEELIKQKLGSAYANRYHSQIKELSEFIKDLANYIDDKDLYCAMEEVLLINGFK